MNINVRRTDRDLKELSVDQVAGEVLDSAGALVVALEMLNAARDLLYPTSHYAVDVAGDLIDSAGGLLDQAQSELTEDE